MMLNKEAIQSEQFNFPYRGGPRAAQFEDFTKGDARSLVQGVAKRRCPAPSSRSCKKEMPGPYSLPPLQEMIGSKNQDLRDAQLQG